MTSSGDNEATVDFDDVSSGRVADSPEAVERVFSQSIRSKFEIYSYRNAASILASSFPEQFSEITERLENFSISKSMIRMPGGSKGPIAKYVDTLFTEEMEWRETSHLERKSDS